LFQKIVENGPNLSKITKLLPTKVLNEFQNILVHSDKQINNLVHSSNVNSFESIFEEINPSLIKELTNYENWKIRTNGVDKLFHLMNKELIKRISGDIEKFFTFTNRLINDQNFKISTSILQIICNFIRFNYM